jgi:chaperonin GroEL (HSP60 family)
MAVDETGDDREGTGMIGDADGAVEDADEVIGDAHGVIGTADVARLDPAKWTIRDEEARTYVEQATDTVASLVRSTLGPSGLEKLIETADLQDERELVLTGDAGEILEAIHRGGGFDHPVAAVFVDMVDSMRRGLSDGTATTVVLAHALVERGFDLVREGLRPGTVVVGYAMAAARAGEVLDELARPVTADDRDRLRQVAATSMTADLPADRRTEYASMVAEAVGELAAASETKWLDTDDAKVFAAGDRPELRRGIVVRRRVGGVDLPGEETDPERWELAAADALRDATVAVVDRELDVEETATPLADGWDAGVRVSSPDALSAYRSEREARLDGTARRLADAGVDVVVAQPGLDDEVRSTLGDVGVKVIDGVQFPESDVHRVARATGGEVVSYIDDLSPDQLGHADRVVERIVDGEAYASFEGDGAAFTLLLGPSSDTEASRRERTVEDALDVTATAAMDGQVLPGAGAPAVAVAADLREYARSVSGREQLAVEAFADALEDVPVALARNAGQDPVATLADLRAAHATADDQPAACGLDVASGDPTDAWESGVVEPRRVFSQAVETARTAVEHLLTVDAVAFPNVDWESFEPRTEHE